MRKAQHLSSELSGILRLILIAGAGVFAAFIWCLRSSEGSGRGHLLAAVCVSLMPLCIAFPNLFRKSRAQPDDTLSRLRNAGAI